LIIAIEEGESVKLESQKHITAMSIDGYQQVTLINWSVAKVAIFLGLLQRLILTKVSIV